MQTRTEPWDYLILTAANQQQAAAYRAQIQIRREIGRLPQVRDVLVAADEGGQRIGSGGSTLQCLHAVLRREAPQAALTGFDAAEAVLRGLRILIVHAGGDSRRLPAYSSCGKIFVPLPGDAPAALTPTLFDRLVPALLALPAVARGAGQIVIAAGDALILFDPSEIRFSQPGIIALGLPVPPAEAARHGVLCANSDGGVRLYLQKPALGEQAKAGAIGADGRSVLDIGVMSLDANAAVRLLRAFGTPPARAAISSHGIDLYREICCALGTDATLEHYVAAVRASGSKAAEPLLAALFEELRFIPFSVQPLGQCHFLHFGSSRQLITSGIELVARDQGSPPPDRTLAVANDVASGARIDGTDSWVEGCRLRAPLTLQGRNVVTGADVVEPFVLPDGACLDVSSGADRRGDSAWFIRYYGVDDTFKHSITAGATFCGRLLIEWLQAAGARDADIWSAGTPEGARTLWNARVFPASKEPCAYAHWRWMLDPDHATSEQKRGFLSADRYSAAEIAERVDQDAFHRRRARNRASEIRRAPGRIFDRDAPFPAHELAFALRHSDDIALMTAELLGFAREYGEAYGPCRVAGLLSAAIEILCGAGDRTLDATVPGLAAKLSDATRAWVESSCGPLRPGLKARDWATRLRELVPDPDRGRSI